MNEIVESKNGLWMFRIEPHWEDEIFPRDYIPDPFIMLNRVTITEDEIRKYLKSKQIDLKQSTIKNLLKELKSISKNFDDITYRQVSWVNFKENINSLWGLATDDDSKSVVIFLMDGINNLKSEKMNKSHLDGFKKVLQKLLAEEVSEMEVVDIAKILIDHRIPVLRFPKGASELLE